jgi:hypothetical protein
LISHVTPMSLATGKSTSLLQCEELVTRIDEGRSAAFASKLEIEQTAVESQSLLDIADLKSYMIETNGAGFSDLNHGALHQLMQSRLPAIQKEQPF